MDTAPRDGSYILAWHKVWRCWLTVKFCAEFKDSSTWIEATLSTRWPEEAFLCWMDCPPGPV